MVVVHPTPFVRYYFVHYFDGQANIWYFHLSLLAIFFLPSVLCKCGPQLFIIIFMTKKIKNKKCADVNFYLTSSRTVATHSRTFALFEGIIRRGEYRLMVTRSHPTPQFWHALLSADARGGPSTDAFLLSRFAFSGRVPQFPKI